MGPIPSFLEDLMSNAPLMPKATAIWLVENTSLSFDQIAEFREAAETVSI